MVKVGPSCCRRDQNTGAPFSLFSQQPVDQYYHNRMAGSSSSGTIKVHRSDSECIRQYKNKDAGAATFSKRPLLLVAQRFIFVVLITQTSPKRFPNSLVGSVTHRLSSPLCVRHCISVVFPLEWKETYNKSRMHPILHLSLCSMSAASSRSASLVQVF